MRATLDLLAERLVAGQPFSDEERQMVLFENTGGAYTRRRFPGFFRLHQDGIRRFPPHPRLVRQRSGRAPPADPRGGARGRDRPGGGDGLLVPEPRAVAAAAGGEAGSDGQCSRRGVGGAAVLRAESDQVHSPWSQSLFARSGGERGRGGGPARADQTGCRHGRARRAEHVAPPGPDQQGGVPHPPLRGRPVWTCAGGGREAEVGDLLGRWELAVPRVRASEYGPRPPQPGPISQFSSSSTRPSAPLRSRSKRSNAGRGPWSGGTSGPGLSTSSCSNSATRTETRSGYTTGTSRNWPQTGRSDPCAFPFRASRALKPLLPSCFPSQLPSCRSTQGRHRSLPEIRQPLPSSSTSPPRPGIGFVHQTGASGRRYFPETMGGGVAFLDYDGDGDLDLYFPNGAPLPGYSGPSGLGQRPLRQRPRALHRGGSCGPEPVMPADTAWAAPRPTTTTTAASIST